MPAYNASDLSTPTDVGAAQIQAGLSTHIIVKVGKLIVGAIQSISPAETRALNRIREVGTDGFIEIVPTGPAEVTLEVERLLFDFQHLPEVFSRGFAHIQSQCLPFDVEIHQEDGTSDGRTIVTTYHNCWMASFNQAFTAGDYLITERATLWAESVSTSSSTPVPNNANNNSSIAPDSIEQWVDQGKGPGALSVPVVAVQQ